MRSEELLAALVADLRPVRRLRAPFGRAVLWLTVSLGYAALVIWYMEPRRDLPVKITETRFLLEVAAALLTSVLAAIGAFSAVVPGRSWAWALAPLPALALWLAALGQGCWQAWLRWGAGGLQVWPDPICFPSIVLAGAGPAVLILAMLRRGAPLAPFVATMLASLAAAALGAAALRFFHAQDASIMVLVWQCGSVAVLTLLGLPFSRSILRWPTNRGIATSV